MDQFSEAGGALAGIRVLDLSRVLAGPLSTMLLGDLGADVIKVERPGSGDETRDWGPPWVAGPSGRESAYFLSVNRNKRSVLADFRSEDDRAFLQRLAAGADVVVENFAPGSLARWGLDYDSLALVNPKLVYCSITGYGSDGPDAGRPGYDFAIQARSGWMAVTGEKDGEPVKVGIAIVDVLTGQNAAMSILAALLERDRSGRGQRIEVALLDSALFGLVNVTQAALAGVPAQRYGNAHPTIVPYQAFPTADATMVVAVGNNDQWRRFCHAVGLDGLATDPRFATNPDRVEHREELVGRIGDHLATRPMGEWLEALERAGVPSAPVRSVEAAVADPTLRERGGVWVTEADNFGRLEMIAAPFRLRRTPPSLRHPPPALGEHDRYVRERGWS
jgi:crotonobetainyl-CoA:carnitine CoA-transferase CaiB-like acyl-CoA transferase